MKLIIVDDDKLICKSLEVMLSKEADIEVIGIASNGLEAMDLCKKENPDIILMDIRMPDVDGIQATHLIKKHYPKVRIMMLTTFQDKQNIQSALKAGAEGYLLKTDKISNIAEKLRIFYEGVTVLDKDVLSNLTNPDKTILEKLTPREKDVILLVSEGLTNKEISSQLFLSEGTIRNIVSVIMDKLGAKNRTQLSNIINENN
ncbi:response regulator transcription factor [Clostridium sp. AL.422]|uniref:response regulator transcription factor n=1 Tax=Clostridium TaxID=1485 RepID=UPI00293DAAE4|nr:MULTISPECIES: response regulator transcription factor [unclassified Clostridium]MDV4150216.1 response regulator transcription factor [Clostridium sp. AL.422]